jgi:hypothetical protein
MYQIFAGPVAVYCGETAAKIYKIFIPDCTGLYTFIGLHEVEGARISGQSVYESGKVVSHTYPLTSPPQEINLVLTSVRG